MSQDHEAFLKELLNDFKIEAAEHLQSITNGLLVLEKGVHQAPDQEVVESVFREIHSMKGAARAVNQLMTERLCMAFESVFHEIKKGTVRLKADMFDQFYKTTDLLGQLLHEIEMPYQSVSENNIIRLSGDLNALIVNLQEREIQNTASTATPLETQESPYGQPNETMPVSPSPHPDSPESVDPSIACGKTSSAQNTNKETVRVATDKLYDVLRKAEEMTMLKSILDYHVTQLRQVLHQFGTWKREHEERILAGNDEDHLARKESCIRDLESLKGHETGLVLLGNNLEQLQRMAGRSVDDLILSVRQTMLQPFSALFMIVPRIVRDLSVEYGKEINLTLKGAEIEIDRRILEEMKDPMIHLIRNCIDHGIETPAERQQVGKPSAGTLSIKVTNDPGRKIRITVKDDGAGLQLDQLTEAAIKSGVISTGDAARFTDKEKEQLVFASGISTRAFITDVSGRGLGMAIVAEKISNLGGTIAIETSSGHGTLFHIILPQTLTTFKGILVQAAKDYFLIPTSSIFKAIQVSVEDLMTIESKNTIMVNNEAIGVAGLAEVLDLDKGITDRKSLTRKALILHDNHKKIAFVVDEVLGEHEGLIKSLGPQLQHVKNIAGVSLLGDGRAVPIINVHELMQTMQGAGQSLLFADRLTATQPAAESPKKILVAEDSITVRNMLRSYLEAAGFEVKTTVDGQEAYEQLRADTYDIVVSDVEMPRMNGFELTESIRQHTPFDELPVILVTALESKEDLKRGMDAGANAYIVKSSFEKGNLIETINRLIG